MKTQKIIRFFKSVFATIFLFILIGATIHSIVSESSEAISEKKQQVRQVYNNVEKLGDLCFYGETFNDKFNYLCSIQLKLASDALDNSPSKEGMAAKKWQMALEAQKILRHTVFLNSKQITQTIEDSRERLNFLYPGNYTFKSILELKKEFRNISYD